MPLPVTRPASALTNALAAAQAEYAAGQARLREAALAWERERDAADALAKQIANTEQLLAFPAAPDGGATSFGSAGAVVGAGHRTSSTTAVPWHDPADPLMAQLHYQAGGVQNIRLLVPVVLEPESPSYAHWRTWSSSLSAATPSTTTSSSTLSVRPRLPCGYDSTTSSFLGSWGRSSWTSTTSSATLHMRALEGQFLGNAEARALRLNASFRTFVQGDLSSAAR